MNKVLLPPLHIKVLYKNGAAFQHLSTVFPGLSAAKLKEGIFVGPQAQSAGAVEYTDCTSAEG